MRKVVFLAVFAVALLTVGLVVGMLFQHQYETTRAKTVAEIVQDLTGANAPRLPAPTWDDWRYPDAKSGAKVVGASLRVMGQLVYPAGHYGVWTTPDPYEDVVRFYAKKTMFKDPDSLTQGNGVFSESSIATDEQPSLNACLSDHSRGQDDSNQGGPRSKCLIRRTRSFAITIFISRSASEKETNIVVVYDPLTDTTTPTP